MTNATLAPVRTTPLCELPAKAVLIATWFCDPKIAKFSGIQIAPDGDGRVRVVGASSRAACIIECDGEARRLVQLPVAAGLAINRRHHDAEHLAVVASDPPFVQIRSYSAGATVCIEVSEEKGDPLPLPSIDAGAHLEPLTFDRQLLQKVLGHMKGIDVIAITPFPLGWRISGTADGVSVNAIIAGIANR